MKGLIPDARSSKSVSKMPMKIKKSANADSQLDKFKAMAKELEADGDEKSFNKTLKQIVLPKNKAANKG